MTRRNRITDRREINEDDAAGLHRFLSRSNKDFKMTYITDVNRLIRDNNHVPNPATPNFPGKPPRDRNPFKGRDQTAGSRNGETAIDPRFSAKEMFRKQRDGANK